MKIVIDGTPIKPNPSGVGLHLILEVYFRAVSFYSNPVWV